MIPSFSGCQLWLRMLIIWRILKTTDLLAPPQTFWIKMVWEGPRCSYFINIASHVIWHWETLCHKYHLCSSDTVLTNFQGHRLLCLGNYHWPILSCLWHDGRNLEKMFASTNSLYSDWQTSLMCTSCSDVVLELTPCVLSFFHSFVQGQVLGKRQVGSDVQLCISAEEGKSIYNQTKKTPNAPIFNLK